MEIKRHLFYRTSHSPALVDIVGVREARHIVDFCYIANPYYPTPGMMSDLQKKLPGLIKSYPSSNPEFSQRHLAQVLRVRHENLIIGNGASELIAFIEESLVRNIGIPVPTFSEYLEKLRDARAAKLFPLKRTRDYRLDLSEYGRWILKKKLRSALVINPGNPTGQFHPLPEILRFLRQVRRLPLVIVDESFIDFAGEKVPSLLRHARKFPNLLIVRSMSKHCGIPGLRLGYAYTFNTNILRRLRRMIPVWNVNSLAEYFLGLLPSTDELYHRGRKRLMRDVQRLYRNMEKIPGFHPYPTGANFVFMRVDNGLTAKGLQEVLLREHRIYVRDCSNKVGLDRHHIRVASQGREKDDVLVKALGAISRKRGGR